MQLTLKSKEHLVDNVWAFRFETSQPLSWVAGQYVRVELPHHDPDGEGAKRWFTNSAAPYEGILQITTRLTQSSFKQALGALEVGSTALKLLEAPEGDFVWQESAKPVVFIAGGIGITPFYSMLKQRFYDRHPLDVTLVYGSRTADVPFKAEFEEWAKADPGLKLHYVIGSPLTAVGLAELLPNLNHSLVYLSGPEPMVEALGDDLTQHGLAKADLKQDFFPNYTETNY